MSKDPPNHFGSVYLKSADRKTRPRKVILETTKENKYKKPPKLQYE